MPVGMGNIFKLIGAGISKYSVDAKGFRNELHWENGRIHHPEGIRVGLKFPKGVKYFLKKFQNGCIM